MARRLPWLMFVLSGAAGLVFEVALQRSLTRVFGVSAFATSTVLAAWMAGLALGALAFGRLADRVKAPLRLYAWLELGIAGVALVVPLVVTRLPALFATIASGMEPEDSRLLLGRFVLAFGLTLVPTLLMGGTLPAVARGLAGIEGIAQLYTANLVGAATGAGLASYALLPAFGLANTQFLGAALNVLAAALAWHLAKQPVARAAESDAPADAETSSVTLLVLAAWSGFVTFCAEVVWFHLLAVVVGNSAYAFGAMLATFLLGLALGSAWLARRPAVSLRLAGGTQLAAAAALTLSLPLWDHVPYIFLIAGRSVESFAGREAVRALVCVYMLLLPSVLLGVLFPLALRVSPLRAQTVGRLSAINTLAAVIASLATGFLLLPAIGSRGVLVMLAVGTAATALLLLRGRWRLAPFAIAAIAFAMPGWNISLLASGLNVYFHPQYYSDAETIWHRESSESGLTTVVKTGDDLTLLTNGKFQGNTGGEVDAQRAFTQLPLLVQHGWGSALVVGLGSGCSSGELARQPWRDIEVVELSQDIVAAADTFFGRVNDEVLHNPRVRVVHADARNALLLSPKKFDLISMEITSIWFAGAADLYNREFNALLREHLNEGGVVQQWVQLHHLTRRDLAVILATLRTAFGHVALFERGGQGIVIASNAPLWLDYAALQKLAETSAATNIPARDPLLLAGHLVLNTDGVDALIAQERGDTPSERFISTDDSLALEFSTPRGNARDDLDAETLLSTLRQFPVTPLELRNADDAGRLHFEAATLMTQGRWAEGHERARAAGEPAQRIIEWAHTQAP